MSKFKCRVCENESGNEYISIREMYLGLSEEFPYYKCSNCGTIQIEKFPENMEKYYPKSSYQSFYSNLTSNLFAKIITKYVAKKSFSDEGLIFKLLWYFEILFRDIYSVKKASVVSDSRILDVGCGIGFTIMNLRDIGFKNVFGIDPFLKQDKIGVSDEIRKLDIYSLKKNELYDLIMFHHSFEHMAEPVRTLTAAKNHLSDDGIILIRIPIISYAFEKYGPNWFQLDAPRHLYTYSMQGIENVFKKAELKIIDKYYDSYSSQFTVSEKYLKNVPLLKQYKNVYFTFLKSIFSINFYKYRNLSLRLNKEGRGDSIVLYLKCI